MMSGDYFQYIVSNVVCVLIFGIMLVHDLVSIDRQEKQIRFDHALVPFMAYFVFDALWAAIEGGMIPKTIVSVALVDFAIAVALGLLTYTWLKFVLAVEKVPNREKPKFRLITAIPFLAFVIGLVITFFVARPFIIDDKLELQVGYYVFMNGSSYLYLVAILVYTIRRAIREKSNVERRKHLMTGLLPLMVVVGGIFQLLLPNVAIFCFSATFLMLIFYIQSMQSQISLDPLTNLNNRGQLSRYLAQENLLRKEHKTTFVVVIDVNDFKKINDTFGHSEGDRALVILSNALRDVATQNKTPMFVARYGGDEFVIIAHPEGEEEIHSIVGSIRKTVASKCQEEGAPYTLSLAIGYDRLGEGRDDFQSCFVRADRKLYADKEQVKKLHPTNYSDHNENKPRA